MAGQAKRVFVTGVGVMCAAGLDAARFWDAIVAADPQFHEATGAPGSGVIVAEIREPEPFLHLGLNVAACDRNALLAVGAAKEALADAGLSAPFARPDRVAAIIGCGGGGIMSVEEQYARRSADSTARPHPRTVSKVMVSSSASWVSMTTGARGPCFVTSSACASATHAIGTALQLLRAGAADIAIAGGTEAPLSLGCLNSWEAMKIMTSTACRPFARGRDGLMLGEGAGVVILETEEHARARGVTAAIELAGYGATADAGSLLAPNVEGMAAAMRLALEDGGLDTGEIAYVNAHGTGTAANDIAEAEALRALFGADSCPPTSSIKGVTGHSLGAAGGVEAVATVLAMRNGIAPPSANFDERDPRCDIDCIPNVARKMAIPAALSNSFAFGGLNAALAFRALG